MNFIIIYLGLSVVNAILLIFALKRVFVFSSDCEKIDIEKLHKIQSNFSDKVFQKVILDCGITNKYIIEIIKKILLANLQGLQLPRRNFIDTVKNNILGLFNLFALLTNVLAVAAIIVIAFIDKTQAEYLLLYGIAFFICYISQIISELLFINPKLENINHKLNSLHRTLYIYKFDYDTKTNLFLETTHNEIVEKNKQDIEKHKVNQIVLKSLTDIDVNSKTIRKQVSEFVDTIIKNKDTQTVANAVNDLNKSIIDMTGSYNKIFRTSESYEKEILKYTDFFKNFNEIGANFKETIDELNKVLVEIEKASNLSTKDQLSSIDANLRKIMTKQVNEIRDVVNLYNESIFGRISYVMNNNLERNNQTLSTMKDIYQQNDKHLKLLKEYAEKVEVCTTTNVMHNQKIFNLIDTNTQLVGFILKRYKFLDGNVINKFMSMGSTSPIDETNSTLDFISSEIDALNKKVNSLKSK